MRVMILAIILSGCATKPLVQKVPVVDVGTIKRSYFEPEWQEPVSKAEAKRAKKKVQVWTGSVTEWIQLQWGHNP